MEKMDFLSLLDTFGVPLKVFPRQEEGGGYNAKGEWIKNTKEDAAVLNVSEPFVPSSLMSQLPVQSLYRGGGRIEDYEMTWFSAQVIPLKSIVEHNGLEYSVEDSIPYTDYSNVTQYGCKAVSTFAKK
ncbi:hypothetical protein [Listeria booriae]|uniref:hypothetical protein n=1 Tax=Listeria booriae TaxID=1552123 RepID=UPI0016281242|nr:hypothetical protein [Listeria booriae]MBC1307896.1 hypothetical protein [Listeria booriae]MBC2391365.1 hypothetical protein [Listeria booriae]